MLFFFFFRIPIIFEGDLAHIAACHLKQNNYVHVAGRLSADPPHLNANLDQANIQVRMIYFNLCTQHARVYTFFLFCYNCIQLHPMAFIVIQASFIYLFIFFDNLITGGGGREAEVNIVIGS